VSTKEYKSKIKADYQTWGVRLNALEPGSRTQEEAELLDWHKTKILEAELASVRLPGGRAKKMEKIKEEMGRDVCIQY